MSTKTVANRIQDIVGASTRITSAPHIENWPAGPFNHSDLPIALTRPGPATWPHEAIADVWCRRTYVTDIYVKPNAQGLWGEGIDETLAIIDDVAGRLTTNFELDTTAGGAELAIDSEPRDKGLVILNYGGVDFRGTSFELDVIEDV